MRNDFLALLCRLLRPVNRANAQCGFFGIVWFWWWALTRPKEFWCESNEQRWLMWHHIREEFKLFNRCPLPRVVFLQGRHFCIDFLIGILLVIRNTYSTKCFCRWKTPDESESAGPLLILHYWKEVSVAVFFFRICLMCRMAFIPDTWHCSVVLCSSARCIKMESFFFGEHMWSFHKSM